MLRRKTLVIVLLLLVGALSTSAFGQQTFLEKVGTQLWWHFGFTDVQNGVRGDVKITPSVHTGRNPLELDEVPLSSVESGYGGMWPIGRPGNASLSLADGLQDELAQNADRSADELLDDPVIAQYIKLLRDNPYAVDETAAPGSAMSDFLTLLRGTQCSYKDLHRNKEVKDALCALAKASADQELQGAGENKLWLVLDLDLNASPIKQDHGVPEYRFEVRHGARSMPAFFDPRFGHRMVYDLSKMPVGLEPFYVDVYYKGGRNYVKFFTITLSASDHNNATGGGMQMPIIQYHGPLTVDAYRDWQRAVQLDAQRNGGRARFDSVISDQLFSGTSSKQGAASSVLPYDFQPGDLTKPSVVTATSGPITLKVLYAGHLDSPYPVPLKPGETRSWKSTTKIVKVTVAYMLDGSVHEDVIYDKTQKEVRG